MKTLRLLIILMLLFHWPNAKAIEGIANMSEAKALEIAKQQFPGKDYDYYLIDTSYKTVTTTLQGSTITTTVKIPIYRIFVDADPLKGWQHDCYILRIEAPQPNTSNSPLVSVIKSNMPPFGILTNLEVKNRYPSSYKLKPKVAKRPVSDANDLSVSGRTYAVIISGGANQTSNYERYWNDCSFVYQTLVNTYNVPKENIDVIMSDGLDPAADMRCFDGSYKSSPLDLDNDGADDIKYAATIANINQVFSTLARKVTPDDHVFVYVIDHGGTDNNGTSFIWLWNNIRIADTQFLQYLSPVTNKGTNVNLVLGQCYAGGFINKIKGSGIVLATACKADESSWACPDRPYDEFVYWWTCAVNGADSFGAKTDADTDKNGFVTMDEAFEYARTKDRRNETPMFRSLPASIGEDLAFNRIPEGVDLYIRDQKTDTGKEPNRSSEYFWDSPDIWLRNTDTVPDPNWNKHENPYYSANHTSAILNVRIINRGKTTYTGGKWLHTYWAKGSTEISIGTWLGERSYDGKVTGGTLTQMSIPGPIAPGDTVIVKTNWALPTFMNGNTDPDNHHYCLLARITDAEADEWHRRPDGVEYVDKRASNDIAQKNVSIIYKKDLQKGTSIFLGSVAPEYGKYSIELRPRTVKDSQLFTNANVEMKMAPKILTGWTEGGQQSNGIYYAPAANPDVVRFTSAGSKLENIRLAPYDFDKVTMNIKFKSFIGSYQPDYTFDLIQRDEDGNIVGGETFIVESPLLTYTPVPVSADNNGDGSYTLSADLPDNTRSVVWNDTNDVTISENADVTVTPMAENSEYSVTVITEDGEMSTGSISVEPAFGIDTFNISADGNMLEVKFRNAANGDNHILGISPATYSETDMRSIAIENGASSVSVDISQLGSGMYVMAYSVDGRTVNSVKFSKH